MLIHSVQTSLYMFATYLYLDTKCKDCRTQSHVCFAKSCRWRGTVLTLPSTCPRGSDTHTAWGWSVCWLWSTCGGRKLLAVHSILCGRASFSPVSSERDPVHAPLGHWCKPRQRKFWGQLLQSTLLLPMGTLWETPTQKVQGQVGYGMGNLLAKGVFAVPALLNCLWQGSFASSLDVLSEWSLWLLPISDTSGNRGHLCAQGHCQVKSFGKGWGVHSFTVKWLLKVNLIILLAVPLNSVQN